MASVHTRSIVHRGSPLSGVIAAILTLATVAPSWAADTGAGGLEEVVVTAQRREANLQTTPVAVTAITGQALADDKLYSA